MKRILLTFVLLFFADRFSTTAQELRRPKVSFFRDSIKLGEPIQLSLTYKHSPKAELLFPDSLYNFFPFEYVSKKYYPTITDTSGSLDSVVYTLSTFELLPRLGISLPVYLYENGDTSALYSNEAYVILKEVIPNTAHQDSLIVNTRYAQLTSKFNYPVVFSGLGILLILAGIIFLFFRKKLMAQFKLYLMKNDFKKFSDKYIELNQVYQQEPNYAKLEDILSLWKKYLEKLEKEPYTSLTTKEISKKFDINQLTSSLQNFDKAIYGGYINEDMTSSINFIRETAERQYNTKREKISNGMA